MVFGFSILKNNLIYLFYIVIVNFVIFFELFKYLNQNLLLSTLDKNFD